MFERFTEEGRRVVVFAQEEARELRHAYIGTEHLLLGMLRQSAGPAGRVLNSLGVELEPVRGDVVAIVGRGEEPAGGQIPFTPRAKQVLDLSLREALGLGHDHVGSEHLLLGLVRVQEGVALQILAGLGAEPETVRAAVLAFIGAEPGAGLARGHRPGPPSSAPDMDRSWLDFTPQEACALAIRLAPLASSIRFEVRSHGEGEETFRVSCRPRGNDDTLRDLVALEDDGIRAVLDHDGTVRLGRIHWPPGSRQAAP